MNARISIGLLLVIALVGVVFLGSRVSYTSVHEALLSYVWKSELDVSAEAWFVVDITHKRIISEQHPDDVRPIASVAKLFTAHAAHLTGVIDEGVVITRADTSTEGTSGSLIEGQAYTLRQLLFPLLLVSSNDAGGAIERQIGRTTFDTVLASVYADAGLEQTVIQDASGLVRDTVSTPRELARFIEYLRTTDPYILDITQLPTYLGPYGGWWNNNPGLGIDGFRGGKHGFTDEAGRTFAGLFHVKGYYREADFAVVLLGSEHIGEDLEIVQALIKRKVW